METIICILLCLLGIATYFLNRFANRTDKSKEPSLKFWWKDNWPELTQILTITTMLMIVILLRSTTEMFAKLVTDYPEGWPAIGKTIMKFATQPVLSAIIGLGGSSIIYNLFRRKVKDTEEKLNQ